MILVYRTLPELTGLAKQEITVHLSFFYGLLMSSPAEDFAVG